MRGQLHSKGFFLTLLGFFAVNLAAQEAADDPACAPNEIDMGDYCVDRPPEPAKLQRGARRATPFRIRGMMPGRVGSTNRMLPGARTHPDTRNEPGPTVAGHGFGVQIGVFSSREKAIRVAMDAAKVIGGPFALSRIQRDEGILWACIHGPFPDKSTAVEAQRRLREQTPFGDAFVKPLDETEPLDTNHARTEE